MANVVIKLNDQGIQELLKSEEVIEVLRTHARSVLNSAGNGYSISEYKGKTRGNVSVYAETQEAYKDNLENNTLLKAVGK